MEAYKCVVRLSGELGQEVPKNNVCAAHIIMMQNEHGADAVHSIERIARRMEVEKSGPVSTPGKPSPTILKPVTQEMARNFLESEFGAEKVGKVFGTFHGAMLPEALKGFESPVSMAKKKNTQGIKSASIAEAALEAALDEVEDEIKTGTEDEDQEGTEEEEGIGEKEEEKEEVL